MAGWTHELPKLDSVVACPKCGSTVHHVVYHRDDHNNFCPVGEAARTDYPREHMLKRCERCGYSWGEDIYRD
jgi:uncharacterized Zn finger protein